MNWDSGMDVLMASLKKENVETAHACCGPDPALNAQSS